MVNNIFGKGALSFRLVEWNISSLVKWNVFTIALIYIHYLYNVILDTQ